MDLQSKLLVADSSIQDHDFFRSVIFVLQHNESGTIGVALNLPSMSGPYQVFLGGPCGVGEHVVMLHGIRRLGRDKYNIMEGLWSGTAKTFAVAQSLPLDDRRYKLITGYAGWSVGQLEAEIRRGDWHVVDATAELVLDGAPEALWENVSPAPTVKPSLN